MVSVIKKIAIIGGSGLSDYFERSHADKANTSSFFVISEQLEPIATPYGDVTGIVKLMAVQSDHLFFKEGGVLYFIPRHGQTHTIPPHQINYRANIHALKILDVQHIISTNAVGGIAENCAEKSLIIPDQVIDYTYGREHTFFDNFSHSLTHIDFSYPFKGEARNALIKAANHFNVHAKPINLIENGVYGCTQGPRLETAAEIIKLKRDGCSIVGMTVMPEAALAREAKIDYASVCLVVNWAAGIKENEIAFDDILVNLKDSTDYALSLINCALSKIARAG